MDWPSSMAMHDSGKPADEQGLADDEEEEDFYGYRNGNGANSAFTNANSDNTAARAAASGASIIAETGNVRVSHFDEVTSKPKPTTNQHRKEPASKIDALRALQPPMSEQKKVENQRKADILRAKLIAQRQNTPGKTLSTSTTPMQKRGALAEQTVDGDKTSDEPHSGSLDDMFGLESLLAEGKAAAEANMNKQNGTITPSLSELQQPSTNMNGPTVQTQQKTTKSAEQMQPSTENTVDSKPETSTPATGLTDAYYADLPIWLEVTGYHDIDYRNAKLHTYKERKALEAEAARIAERLEKLKQAEQANIESLRSAPTHPTPAAQNRPVLPTTMPNGDAGSAPLTSPHTEGRIARVTNGVKRQHSPEPTPSMKARRDDTTGFRIRGANDSPTTNRPQQSRSPVSAASGAGLLRRISHPEARGRYVDGQSSRHSTRPNSYGSRDPSLERRQAYYRREQESAAPVHGGYDREWDRYNQTYGRDTAAPRGYEGRGRLSYSNVSHRSSTRGPERNGTAIARTPGKFSQIHRGSAGLDLKKGGVRYFLIKSWNHDNVVTAMRDSVWATQQKNEQMLTEAYKTCRHVILLFSVNKSMAFQGYALMISPPDPSVPIPSFCAKLNWGTSPAFTLRWLGTTPVHFRHVGHLKNELNRDEDDKAMAVLVGKDGQEVSPEAGMGMCWILDEVEKVEEGKRKNGGEAGRWK